MNREIKFQGKRKGSGEWICGFLYKVNERSFICTDDIITTAPYWHWDYPTFGEVNFVEVDPATVRQFIGRENFEKVEICEGNYVQSDEKYPKLGIGVVVWDNENARFKIEGENYYDMMGEKFDWYHLKVIGNIFDNPELLKAAGAGKG